MASFQEMKKLTIGKYTASFNGLISYAVSTIAGRPVMTGMPFAVGIELTNRCNLACPECPSGNDEMKRERGFMNSSLFEKIVGEPGSAFLHANLYFQGEPMLHPEFFELLGKASALKTVVATNGHFLGGENAGRLAASGLSRLIVSLDGTDQETYSVYRRKGNIDKVLRGLTQLSNEIRRIESGLKVEIQFLVNRFNEQQIGEARVFAKKLGFAFRLKSMQIIHRDQTAYWQPAAMDLRRYDDSESKGILRNSLPNRCSRLWFNPVITWDGLVVPCCFDKDAEHVMGDMNSTPFSEIWYGEKYTDFRRRLLHDRKSIAICTNCTEGLWGVKT
jgi:radical SAM protein with 4Fe4S-binding SPASM domain